MRDIPVFTTDYGVASLSLKEIPYSADAYIRIQSASDIEMLIEQCSDFCKAAGAERIYATGHPYLNRFPLYTSVICMSCSRNSLPNTDAALFPVQEHTLSQWRDLYNSAMQNVPTASYMSISNAEKILGRGVGYFVYRENSLLGIGVVTQDKIEAIATVVPGEGKDVLCALCHTIFADTVKLDVATANTRAIRLYEHLGFVKVSSLTDWYQLS